MKKIYLGKVNRDFKSDYVAGGKVYIERHEWACNWYWGFGYIGNTHLHTHFDSCFLNGEYDVKKIFEDTKISQGDWWKVCELMQQAYNLKQAYETYYRGGAHLTSVKDMGIVKNLDVATILKNDMEKILNDVWNLLMEVIQ